MVATNSLGHIFFCPEVCTRSNVRSLDNHRFSVSEYLLELGSSLDLDPGNHRDVRYILQSRTLGCRRQGWSAFWLHALWNQRPLILNIQVPRLQQPGSFRPKCTEREAHGTTAQNENLVRVNSRSDMAGQKWSWTLEIRPKTDG